MTEQRSLQDQCHLLIEGEAAPREALQRLMRVTVEQGLHLPSLCTVRIQDDNLELADGNAFAIGKALRVEMGTGNNLETIFDGEIVALELQPTAAGAVTLVVRAYDRSHRLHRGRQTATFVQMTDSDIATRIAREAGLDPDVESTSEVYEYILQDNRTHYEFLRDRAERIGFAFWVDEGKLHFRRPSASPPAPIVLEWGRDLLRFHPVQSAGRQVDEVIVRGWDPQAKRAIVGRATRGRGAAEVGDGRPGGQVAASAFGQAKVVVVQRPVRTQGEADALAQALCDELSQAYVRAEGQTNGTVSLRPGQVVEIHNVGRRFGGKYYVTQAIHSISTQAGYRTDFSAYGTQAQTLLDLVQPEAEGREWVCIGIVTNNRDPDNMGRVKVKLPWLGDDVESTWARLAAPMAGQGRGFFYLPEVNDEVLVAFEHGDVNRPYVLGALWNGRDTPPRGTGGDAVDASGHVVQRILKTRAGHLIVLDDSDTGGGITIQDKSGNKIVIDTASNAMQIKAQGEITVEGTQGVTIKSTGPVMVKSSAKATVDAPQIELVEGGTHPLVCGDELLSYLTQVLSIYQSHMHPGMMAGPVPVTPSPPVPPLPTPPPTLLSMKTRTG